MPRKPKKNNGQFKKGHKSWNHGMKITVHCAWCGKEKKVKPYIAKKTKNHFCTGTACRGKWQSVDQQGINNSSWKGGKITLICAHCGKAKDIFPSHQREQDNFFCGSACHGKWNSENLIGEKATNWRGGGVLISCAYCGKEKTIPRSYVNESDNYFCDTDCYGKYQDDTIMVDCTYCKSPVPREWAHLNRSDNHFCNNDCYKLWKIKVFFGSELGDELREKYRKTMLNGHAAYMNTFKNPLTEEQLAKMSLNSSGANNPNWRGGISFEVYPREFDDKLKKKIKDRDNNQCQNDECWHTSDHLSLEVHHIYHEKDNSDPNCLITLCKSCNDRANFNRDYWRAKYASIIAKKTGNDYLLFGFHLRSICRAGMP